MKIERFEVPGLAQYAYMVSDGGEAVVVDPMRDVERYVKYAQSEGVRIKAIVETHIHADFAAGSCELAAITGAELALSAYDEGEHFVYAMPHRKLRDGDSVRVGNAELKALHTPGHTPEHLSYLLYEEGSETPVAMFSGDFLFVGSLGRPDLLGEDAKVELAHSLYRSVQQMRALPDALKAYPGHGAGSLCGAGMRDATETALGAERAMNPFFHLGEEAFVAEILATVPELPAYYPRMKALNAKGAVALELVRGAKALPVERVAELVRAGSVTLLDVRSVEAFSVAHVPGALHIAAGPSFSMWAGWLVDVEKPIVLVTDGGDDAAIRVVLARVGLDEVMGHLDGGVAGWAASGMPVAVTPRRSAEDVERSAEMLVLDVRNDQERGHGSIPGSVHVILGDLPGALASLPRDREVVTVCESGLRASIAASLLERAGIDRVSTLAGGMAAWERAELVVVR
ncbi:MBL fold metallo-hydrolase [Granulicella sp. 5B5]|uniref:MBL fold metallo-hydrolase n=1 Tax=Granulicella sp. 5B5 TaxID=1617967 RepID=UPI0015F4CCAD|nr:MBL fold metallo-hydrolase [Granulicella sp. 5B5]QMV17852.1 MBL fold metallo-hydrolase [Granulicella sp. 5B5]